MDIHAGRMSVIFETISGTSVGFEKVTVHVSGPPVLSSRDAGETDLVTVRAGSEEGKIVVDRNPEYLYFCPLFAAAHGCRVCVLLTHRICHV